MATNGWNYINVMYLEVGDLVSLGMRGTYKIIHVRPEPGQKSWFRFDMISTRNQVRINEVVSGRTQLCAWKLYNEAQRYIKKVCQKFGVDETHGLEHALKVKSQLEHCLERDTTFHLDDDRQHDLILAALFHDIDDHKYFPSDSHNALDFLKTKVTPESTERILRWIGYISMSKWGNDVPPEAITCPWVLWPRYCDRIEAVGHEGLTRMLDFSHQRGLPDFVSTTPKPTTEE